MRPTGCSSSNGVFIAAFPATNALPMRHAGPAMNVVFIESSAMPTVMTVSAAITAAFERAVGRRAHEPHPNAHDDQPCAAEHAEMHHAPAGHAADHAELHRAVAAQDRMHGGAASEEQGAEQQREGECAGECAHGRGVVRVMCEGDVERMPLTIVRRCEIWRRRKIPGALMRGATRDERPRCAWTEKCASSRARRPASGRRQRLRSRRWVRRWSSLRAMLRRVRERWTRSRARVVGQRRMWCSRISRRLLQCARRRQRSRAGIRRCMCW